MKSHPTWCSRLNDTACPITWWTMQVPSAGYGNDVDDGDTGWGGRGGSEGVTPSKRDAGHPAAMARCYAEAIKSWSACSVLAPILIRGRMRDCSLELGSWIYSNVSMRHSSHDRALLACESTSEPSNEEPHTKRHGTHGADKVSFGVGWTLRATHGHAESYGARPPRS
jgi:hypothetical protein